MNRTEPDAQASDALGLGPNASGRRGAWLGIAAFLALAAAGLAAWYFWGGGGGAEARAYVTEPIARGDLRITVTATGTLQPINEVEISSELSGVIRRVLVDFNDHVVVGQPLAELDTDRLEAEVAHARAALAAARAGVKEAQATVAEAQRNFERYRALAERSVASEQRFEEARATYARAQAIVESAKANVAVAEAELRLQETNLAKACICSPINGIVLSRNVEPGQTVAATLQAPVLFTLAEDLTAMELRVDVDEADISLVTQGQDAVFTVDAYPDRSFPAKVTKVRYAPETTEGVVTYKTQLAVDNAGLLLRPGMTATADIMVRTVHDVLTVPNEALRFAPAPAEEESRGRGLFGLLPRPPARLLRPESNAAGGPKRVWVLKGGVPTAVPVTVGLSDGRRTQIVAGDLAAGEAVIVDEREPGR